MRQSHRQQIFMNVSLVKNSSQILREFMDNGADQGLFRIKFDRARRKSFCRPGAIDERELSKSLCGYDSIGEEGEGEKKGGRSSFPRSY